MDSTRESACRLTKDEWAPYPARFSRDVGFHCAFPLTRNLRVCLQRGGTSRDHQDGFKRLAQTRIQKKSGRAPLVRSPVVAVLLERYLECKLDLAFRLGRAGKETEVRIRHSIVGLRRTLERAKGCLIPGIEEVRSKDDTSLLFPEWKHFFQR